MSETLVIGSIALDTIGTSTEKVVDSLGGSASYGSVAASYFSKVRLVGIVGSDFDQAHVRMFKRRGIDVDGLERKEGETFRWHGYYERNMNVRHSTMTALNVFEQFAPTLTPEQARAPFVFLANIQPALQLSVLDQVRAPKLVVMDTMDFWIEGQKSELTRVIRRADILMISEQEARQYAETPNTVEAGHALRRLGPRAVVVKKGEHGALVFMKDRIASVPAYPLSKVKDPTGAGDVFAGALTGFLARLGKVTDDNIVRAVHIGCVMASFCVEDFSVKRLLRAKPAEVRERSEELAHITWTPKISLKSIAARK